MILNASNTVLLQYYEYDKKKKRTIYMFSIIFERIKKNINNDDRPARKSANDDNNINK